MATPSFNPLVGWSDPNGSLVGWNGQQNSFGGVGKDDGYNGKVDNWADFGKALGWGAGAVFGGPLAAALAIGNMVVGANTGTSPSTLNSLKQGAISLGLMDAPRGAIGTVSNDLTTADFGGRKGEVSSSTGTTDANRLSDFSVNVSEPAGALGFGQGSLLDHAPGAVNGLGNITGNSFGSMNSLSGDPIGDAAEFNAGVGGDSSGKNAEGKASFATGGFTGGQEGQPRGTVHGQELVLSAPLVRALGPVAGELDAMNALAAPRQGSGPRSWAEMIMMRHPEAWG